MAGGREAPDRGEPPAFRRTLGLGAAGGRSWARSWTRFRTMLSMMADFRSIGSLEKDHGSMNQWIHVEMVSS